MLAKSKVGDPTDCMATLMSCRDCGSLFNRNDIVRRAIRLLPATCARLAIVLTSAHASRDRMKRHRRRVTGHCYDDGFGLFYSLFLHIVSRPRQQPDMGVKRV